MTDQTTTIFTVYSRPDDGTLGDWTQESEHPQTDDGLALSRAQGAARAIVSEGRQSKVTQTERQPAARYVDRANPVDLASYDYFIVAFSGGKDSMACLLHLLDQGVDRRHIELWHHDVDGRETEGLMDWPVTADYCRQVARAFNIPIYFSWKAGGFEREMLRDGTATAPTYFETPTGTGRAGGKGKPGTRRKFPQVSANLSVRWCSAYLKIDPAAIAIRNQARFTGARTLVITGARAEESASRAKYSTFEPHRAHTAKRHVDQWRPVHAWTEAQVWEIMRRHGINPHPAYNLGWGRLSCAACIFGSRDQWASLRKAAPAQFAKVAKYEKEFGVTIKRSGSITQAADRGTCYQMTDDDIRAARSSHYTAPVIIDPADWTHPAGAFGDLTGPA